MSKKASKRPTDSPAEKGPSKLETLLTLLRQPQGASIAELASATGWQNHSVRGALAGILKKKGHSVDSEIFDGVRRYRITGLAA